MKSKHPWRLALRAAFPHTIPELIGVAVTAALHLWRRNSLLSIAVGTAVYMALVQFVFV